MPLLLLLSAGIFVVGVGAFGVIGVVTPMSRDLALSPIGASWVMGAYAVAYALGSPIATSLAGRLERRTVLALGMGLFALGAFVSAVAAASAPLYAGRVIMALGSGLYSPAAAAVGIAMVAPERRGRALATVYGGLTLAQVAGVPIGSYVGYVAGWSWLFLVVSAAAAAMALALWLRVPRAIPVGPATLRDLGATVVDIRLTVALMLTVTAMGAAWIPYTFLAPIIEEKTGGGAEVVAALLVVYGIGSVAGNILGGLLTDRFGAVRALMVSTIAPLPFVAALTLAPWSDPWIGAVLLFAWASVGWALAVAQQARLVSLDPGRTQVLLSLNAACIYVGAAIGASVAGFAKSAAGVPGLGIAGLVMGLVGIANLALTARLGARRG